MKKIRKHRVAIVLFIIATIFYLLGMSGVAFGLSFVGIFFEAAGWISLFNEGRKESNEEET